MSIFIAVLITIVVILCLRNRRGNKEQHKSSNSTATVNNTIANENGTDDRDVAINHTYLIPMKGAPEQHSDEHNNEGRHTYASDVETQEDVRVNDDKIRESGEYAEIQEGKCIENDPDDDGSGAEYAFKIVKQP